MEVGLAVLVHAALWCISSRLDSTGLPRDLVYLIGGIAWIYRGLIWENAGQQHQQFLHDVLDGVWYQNSILLVIFFNLLLWLVPSERLRYHWKSWREAQGPAKEPDYRPKGSNPLRPLVFPCRTTHTRLFPKKHSFSYSYLFVGIPVGWRGSVGSVFSADLESLSSKDPRQKHGWLSVESADYLNRGDDVHGLQGKIDSYLQSQNENPADYAYAYLITAPRFLGYSFNPVSFWYLYNDAQELKAMVLEVNNTFDERRMYFLRNSESDAIGHESMGNGAASGKFAIKWVKDFHVSPFNSRKGSYSLLALDPFSPHLNGKGPVDNTITLSSSKDHPKLVARIFSTSDPINPSTVTRWDTFKFFLSWWWVGLVTFPRIVREAGKLFFRRKLHVWYRPEVLKDSIGRTETQEERAIALLFRDFLASQVQQSDLPLPIKYIPALPTPHGIEVFISSTTPSSLPISSEALLFQPTTPLFYAQIARATKLPKFLLSSLQHPDLKTHTFHTSYPNILTTIFLHPTNTNPPSTTSLPLLERLPWLLIALLRNPRTRTLSQFDAYAIHHHRTATVKVRAYRVAVLRLLVSDYIAFGNTVLLDIFMTGMRIWLWCVFVRYFGGKMGAVRWEGERGGIGHLST